MQGNSVDQSMQIRLLGSFEIQIAGRLIEAAAWRRRHAKQLVKVLAVHPQHRLQREQLMESLWPDSPPRRSANNLNKALYLARRTLEPMLKSGSQSCFLHRTSDSIALVSQTGITTDLEQFEALAETAIRSKDLQQLRQCCRAYKGDLFADEPYDDLFSARREELNWQYQRVLVLLAEQSAENGQLAEAIDILSRLTGLEPLNEDYQQRLMTLYWRNNQRNLALTQFDKYKDRLHTELGELPDEKIHSLYSQISSADQVYCSGLATPSIASASETNLPISNSIAVLPFENTRQTEDLEYLCDGITENLIYRLSQHADLQVMARSTVFRLKTRFLAPDSMDPKRIRQELGVEKIVTGRISWQKERIRIWVEVVSARDGLLEWAQNYNRATGLIFQLENEIAADVSAHFHASTDHSLSPAIPRQQTSNLQAYHQYLKGRYHWNKRTGTGLSRALGYFQSAIEHDPVYALAYSGLADTYNLLSLYTSAAPHDTMPKARAAATTALQLNSQLSEGYTSMAYCQLSYDWDWQQAESSFQHALALNAHYATAHQWYHKLLVARARFDEASAQIARAKKLDPLSPMIAAEEGWGLYYSRKHEMAAAYLNKVLQDDPEFEPAHYILGLVYSHCGNTDKAISHLDAINEPQQGSSPFVLQIGALGYTFALAGYFEHAETQLSRLKKITPGLGTVPYAMAQIYTGMNRPQRALTALAAAADDKCDRLIFLSVEPLFDTLRANPDMLAILQRLDTAPSIA